MGVLGDLLEAIRSRVPHRVSAHVGVLLEVVWRWPGDVRVEWVEITHVERGRIVLMSRRGQVSEVGDEGVVDGSLEWTARVVGADLEVTAHEVRVWTPAS